MGLTYFKRFRMEIDVGSRSIPVQALPRGYRLLPWEPSLLGAHVEAKHGSFRQEIDANVFPCLGHLEGCHRLMTEITRKEGFLPSATWLLVFDGANADGSALPPRGTEGEFDAQATTRTLCTLSRTATGPQFCGTIQGVRDRTGMGAVQNIGITPEHRGLGLGTVLIQASLEGFRLAGVRRVYLEVTAQNDGAIRLYRRIGFQKARTVYKAVEVAECALR